MPKNLLRNLFCSIAWQNSGWSGATYTTTSDIHVYLFNNRVKSARVSERVRVAVSTQDKKICAKVLC